MRKRIILLTVVIAGTFTIANCENDQTTSNNETIENNVAKERKTLEPIEVTNFRNKLIEISKSDKNLTDSEKASILLPAAKDIIDVHGMPQDVSKEPNAKNDDEQNAILGFRRFVELIQNK